jgi:hypothetical protein
VQDLHHILLSDLKHLRQHVLGHGFIGHQQDGLDRGRQPW